MATDDYELEEFAPNPVLPMMHLLRTGVLHTTSVKGFRGIRESGSIQHNKGQFLYAHGQTKRASYGHSKGYICLFDFESADEKQYLTHHMWPEFFYNLKPVTITLKLNREQLAEKLIPNSARPKPGEKGFREALPYVLALPLIEVWYPDDIPTSAIDSYIVTCGNRDEIAFCQFASGEVGELERILSLPDIELTSTILERNEHP